MMMILMATLTTVLNAVVLRLSPLAAPTTPLTLQPPVAPLRARRLPTLTSPINHSTTSPISLKTTPATLPRQLLVLHQRAHHHQQASRLLLPVLQHQDPQDHLLREVTTHQTM